MKESRIRRNAEHVPAGVKIEESFDERGKKHISIVATQGSANLRDIATLRPEDLKEGQVFASSADIRSARNAISAPPASAVPGVLTLKPCCSNRQLSDIGVKVAS